MNQLQPPIPVVPAGEVFPPSFRSPSSFSRRPWLDALAAVLMVGFFVGGTWASYWAEHRNDQYQLLGLGECVYGGEKLYVDCWENKPPGLAWINAVGLVLTAGDPTGAWVLPGIVGAVCVLVLWYAVAELLGPTPGRRAAVLSAALFSTRVYDAASINPDYYAAILELAAASLWLVAVVGEGRWRRVGFALVAGLIWSAATAVKQTGCVGLLGLTVVAAVLLIARAANARRWSATASASWVGFAAGCAAVIFVLSRQGVLSEAKGAVIDFNRSLLDLTALGRAVLTLPRRASDFVPLHLPICLSAFGVLVTLLVGRAGPVSKAMTVWLAVWAASATCLALAGPSGSMRYWQALFPPLIVLSGVALFHLGEMFRQLEKCHHVAFVVLSIAAMFPLTRPLFQSYKLGPAESYVAYSQPGNERKRFEANGAELRELIPPGERMFVWGYDAGWCVHADRRPLSQFTYPRSASQMEEILTDLASRKAYAVLVPQHGSAEFNAWCEEDCRTRRDAVLKDYKKTRAFDGYDVWLREAGRIGG